MYSECASCHKLGKSCKGKCFHRMPPQEMRAWCKERKKFLGLTNVELAELSKVPSGTIDSMFGNGHTDFKYSSIVPVLNVLVGNLLADDDCPELTSSEKAAYEERIKHLEGEIKWREDKIQHLTKNNESMETLVANSNARHTADKDFLRSEMTRKNNTIATLSLLLGVSVVLIMTALVIDGLNSDIGFFWLDGALQSEAIVLFLFILALGGIGLGIMQYRYKRKQKKIINKG